MYPRNIAIKDVKWLECNWSNKIPIKTSLQDSLASFLHVRIAQPYSMLIKTILTISCAREGKMLFFASRTDESPFPKLLNSSSARVIVLRYAAKTKYFTNAVDPTRYCITDELPFYIRTPANYII